MEETTNLDNIFNPDGSLRSGDPSIRPDTTPNELEMSPLLRQTLIDNPRDSASGYYERKYHQLMPQMAPPGDQKAKSLWVHASEAGESFMSGLRRSRYNYFQAAQNTAMAVAEKFGLEPDVKRDFLAASVEKYKNMRINPTTTEWEDQLFYLIGNLVPDVVGLVIGGGIMGGALGMGTKAAGFSKKTALIANLFGRIGGDTGVNVLQFMAHEAGQAELEGREAQYGEAAKTALVMGAAMSTIARTSNIMGLKKRYTVPMMAGIGAGLTQVSMDDEDPTKTDAVIANGVLFGLFGLAIPSAKRVGARDIFTWAKAKRELGQAPDSMVGWTKDFFTEFMPETYHKTFVSDKLRDEGAFNGAWGDPRFMSPKDDFLLLVSQVTDKDAFGHSDNQLVHLVADMMDEVGLAEFMSVTEPQGRPSPIPQPKNRVSGVDRATTVQSAKIILRGVNDANEAFMKDYPDYKTLIEQPGFTPPTYTDRKVKPIKTDNPEGFIAKDDKGNSLYAHQLSLNEYISLFGDSPESIAKHKEAIETAAYTYLDNKKSTWPNKGGLIQHDMYKDWGEIWREPKAFVKRPANVANIDTFTENSIKGILESDELLHAALKRTLAETELSSTDQLYKWFVDASGRLYDKLEKMPGGVAVRNAIQLMYTSSGKVHLQMNELIKEVGFDRMSPRYRAMVTDYITTKAEMDFQKRVGFESGPRGEELKKIVREKPIRGEVYQQHLESIERKANREFGELGGFAEMQKKIETIESKYAELFDRAHEAGLVGPETFEILKDYKWIPQKAIDQATKKFQGYILESGKARQKSIDTPDFLHDLIVEANLKDKVHNIEHLTQEWMSVVENGIARNTIWTEMAKLESPLWTLANPKTGAAPPVPKANFKQKFFMSKGERIPIWVESKFASMLESQQHRTLSPNLSRIFRLVSGTQATQLTAVATNPFFAIFTHPLDLFHIMTHHKDLDPYVPTMISDFYIHNEQTGFLPFWNNFKSAWNKDKVFQDYVLKDDGTMNTIVDSIARQEQMRKSTDYLDEGSFKESYKKYYNGLIDALGKFGHTMEIATRMTEGDMLFATKKFKTKKEANHESIRRLNYARRGQITELIDTWVPFANAQAQILASNLSEVKTLAGAKRVASTMGQLVLGIGMTRAFVENQFPEEEFYKHIPWELRMRYPFIIPTGGKEHDDITKQMVSQYIKIKMAYNPIFTLVNAALQIKMDQYYYGEDGTPPLSVLEMAWDAIKVAAPTEFQSLIPPSLKVATILTGNFDIATGGRVYKGPIRELRDEINDYQTGGVPTHSLAIATGRLLDAVGAPEKFTSPARIQGSYDAWIAQNPLTWLTGSFIGYPEETQHTMIAKAAKYAGLRKFLGVTNPGWVEYEDGTKNRQEAGSDIYHKYSKLMLDPMYRFHKNETSPNQYQKEIQELIKDADDETKIRMATFMKGDVRSRSIMNQWYKRYEREEIYGNIPRMNFWQGLKNTNSPKYAARRFFEAYLEVESKEWRERYLQYGKAHGLFANRWFKAEFSRLQNEERKRQ